ncbi:MAG: DUF4286 family protein [Phycisphaerales bacterium JB039]
MSQIAYTVTATLPDRATAEAYIQWLREGHMQQVIDGGALSGQAFLLEGDGPHVRVESRYIFPDREAFNAYERTTAPALRADGQRRFGQTPGVSFERRIGQVLT